MMTVRTLNGGIQYVVDIYESYSSEYEAKPGI